MKVYPRSRQMKCRRISCVSPESESRPLKKIGWLFYWLNPFLPHKKVL